MFACWNRVVVVVVLLAICSVAQAQDKVTLLRNLEKRVLGPTVVEGPRQHDELIDYYLAANPRLKSHLEQAKGKLLSGEATKTRPFRHLTLIAGIAGVGKSTAFRNFVKDPDLKSNIYKCDLKEDFYQEWQQQGWTEARPDLRSNGLVLNQMLALKPDETGNLLETLRAQEAKIFYLDSLDEIHPDEYSKTLQTIEQFVRESKRPYLHVIVLGRPEAFWDYWVHHRCRLPAEQLDLFILNGPQLRTTGDLAVSDQSYDEWQFELCWKSGKHLTPDEYLAFQQHGYQCSGKFSEVLFKGNAHVQQRSRKLFQQWAKRHPEVRYSLNTLAGSGFWHEIAEHAAERTTRFNLMDLEEEYFSLCLLRDTRPIDRPSSEKPKYLDLYRRLLEQVALDYDDINQLDAQGYFRVSPDAKVTVDYQGEPVSFSVVDLLDRSGLVSLDLNVTGERRYRFEPFWFHRFLVERALHRQNAAKPSLVEKGSR